MSAHGDSCRPGPALAQRQPPLRHCLALRPLDSFLVYAPPFPSPALPFPPTSALAAAPLKRRSQGVKPPSVSVFDKAHMRHVSFRIL